MQSPYRGKLDVGINDCIYDYAKDCDCQGHEHYLEVHPRYFPA